MSILKGILHHWNKKNNAYDTIHPETESAQVTDWDSGIGATLAKTTLGSLISTLSSDSFAAKVVKLVLDATGMKYSMGTNGYICFGSLFGGLIIQWLYVNQKNGIYRTGTFPIAFSNVFRCFGTMVGTAKDSNTYNVIWNDNNTTNTTVQFRVNDTENGSPVCLAIGKA